MGHLWGTDGRLGGHRDLHVCCKRGSCCRPCLLFGHTSAQTPTQRGSLAPRAACSEDSRRDYILSPQQFSTTLHIEVERNRNDDSRLAGIACFIHSELTVVYGVAYAQTTCYCVVLLCFYAICLSFFRRLRREEITWLCLSTAR